MNWYAAEQEIGYRKSQAIAAGERSRMMRELDAMQAQRRREQRMKFLAFVNAKWQALRRAKTGREESQPSMTQVIPSAGKFSG